LPHTNIHTLLLTRAHLARDPVQQQRVAAQQCNLVCLRVAGDEGVQAAADAARPALLHTCTKKIVQGGGWGTGWLAWRGAAKGGGERMQGGWLGAAKGRGGKMQGG